MPLIFSSAAQAAFFWVFLALFAAASVTALIFLRKTKLGLFTAPFFLSFALVCLVPKYPLIYLSCLLFSLSLLGHAFQRYPVKLLLSLLGALGQGLFLTQVLIFLSLSYPYWMIPLPACLFFGIERLFLCVFHWSGERALSFSFTAVYVAAFALCVVLLIKSEFYYAVFLALFGYCYLLGESCMPGKEEDKIFGRNFFKGAFCFLGALLIFFGLSLYIAA